MIDKLALPGGIAVYLSTSREEFLIGRVCKCDLGHGGVGSYEG